jgi:chromosome segregation ATPase
MEAFSKGWTNPENVKRLDIIKSKLTEFKRYQKEIETISVSIDNLPANKIVLQDAAPKASILVNTITKIINIEAKQAATPKRKALLGMMADIRGTTARSLAVIRAYLLSGNSKFNEVKELANQTAKATEEIGNKVQTIQSNTGNAVDAIGEIGTIINKINDISNTIASAVEEQSAKTSEMSRNVQEVAKGVGEISQNISGVSTAAEETTQGSSQTKDATNELSKLAVDLQGLVGKFKI